MFKETIRELRKSKNITQNELAEYIFVSRSTIAKWENGGGFPSDANIESLCHFFNITEEQLMGEINKSKQRSIIKKDKKIYVLSSIIGIAVPLLLCILSFIGIYKFVGHNDADSIISLNVNKESIFYFLGIHIVYSFTIYLVTFVLSILNLSVTMNLKIRQVFILNIILNILCIVAFAITLIVATINAYNSGWILSF